MNKYCLAYYMRRHEGNGPNLKEEFESSDDDKARQRVKEFTRDTDRVPLSLMRSIDFQR